MITAIANQPIALNDTRFQGCPCLGPVRCVLAGREDVLQVQVAGVLCSTAQELLDDTSTTDGTTWNPGAWQQIAGAFVRQSCLTTEGISGDPAPLYETGFTPTIGNWYTVSFRIESISLGSVLVSFGGVELGYFDAVGDYTYTIQAINTQSFVFDNGEEFVEACVSFASVKDTNTDLTVGVINTATGNFVDSWTFAGQPLRFIFIRDHFIVEVPVGEIGSGGLGLPDGCYTIRVIDNCDEVTLESECISVNEHPCAIRVTACNNNDLGGLYFSEDFTVSSLLHAEISRPTFTFDIKDERLSNGVTNRYYADRQSLLELRIGYLSEFGHDFVSSLIAYDHVYFGQTEYVIGADAYTPEYNDVWADTAPVKLKLIPKQELLRKVRCEEDNGSCAPPPNYWVENTGPNEDYILNETDASRIPLHS